jgi:hypothetical protein
MSGWVKKSLQLAVVKIWGAFPFSGENEFVYLKDVEDLAKITGRFL